MRFDTHRVSAFLVEELQKARPALEVINDSGDILHVRGAENVHHSLYFIENPITVYEIRNILHENAAAGVHSAFILWGELFLPREDTRYRPERNDWMAALLAIHHEKIYAFDPYADQVIFPVHFDRIAANDALPGHPADRQIRYGRTFQAARLHPLMVETRSPLIAGRWYMTSFEVGGVLPQAALPDLTDHFFRLGLNARHPLTREILKRAYRQRARELHPDLNARTDATEQMQHLNRAYARLLHLVDHEA